MDDPREVERYLVSAASQNGGLILVIPGVPVARVAE